MLLTDAARAWREEGFAVVPGHLSAADLAPALGELELCFPTAEGFHRGTDPRRERFLRDEFDGIDAFPGHTVLVPTRETALSQVEVFVYLVDVPDELGAPRLVPTAHLHHLLRSWPYRTRLPSSAGTANATQNGRFSEAC